MSVPHPPDVLRTVLDGCASDERAALIHRDAAGDLQRMTWKEVASAANRMASDIRRHGFRAGDRLIHACGNTREGVIVALASLRAGTIEVPLDPQSHAAQRESQIRCVDGRWYEPSSPGRLASFDIEPNHSPDAAAIILFTSGSTGQPRGVTLSRRNLFSNAAAKLAAVPQSSADVRLTLLPLWHAYARTCDMMTWLLSRCTLAIGLGWDGLVSLGDEVSPTMMNTVPSLASRLDQYAGDSRFLQTLRVLGCGGATMPPAVFQSYRSRGITVIHGYGLTEMSPVVCSATPTNSRIGYVGTAVDGCQLKIDAQGQIVVRGSGVMRGYWNDPDATRDKFINGWLQTGDCGELDAEDHQVKICGRMDDRITLSNGLKFFPEPIEHVLASLPGVRHALLVPGERHVDLFVEFDSPVRSTEQGYVDFDEALASIPRWQRPRSIRTATFSNQSHLFTPKGTLRRRAAIAAVSMSVEGKTPVQPSADIRSER